MAHQKLKPKERKQQILDAAIKVTVRVGFNSLTREAIATEAKVSDGTVSFHFNTMKQLRRALARYAMKTHNGAVLSMLVSDKEFKSLLKPEHIQLAVKHITG
jgi:AcrR family transcriptional regulator